MAVVSFPPAPMEDNPFLRRSWKKGTAIYGGRMKKRREEEAAKAAQSVVPKGVCPKCHARIGRGIALHVKRCNGPDQNAC